MRRALAQKHHPPLFLAGADAGQRRGILRVVETVFAFDIEGVVDGADQHPGRHAVAAKDVHNHPADCAPRWA